MYTGTLVSGELKEKALNKLKGNWKITIEASIIFCLFTGIFLTNITSMYSFVNNHFRYIGIFNIYKIIFSKFPKWLLVDNPLLLLFFMILEGPFFLGFVKFSMKIAKKEKAEIKDLFFAFTKFRYFIESFFLYLLITILSILGTLLFIVPGIILALRYALAFFVMNDDVEISATSAMSKSKELMEGNKGRFFTLVITFIGWDILSFLTLGLAKFFVAPYFITTCSEFYQELINGNRK
ncbi:DUF975 family protein [Haloimpatiens sp. FM7315]|uniref:DUF975 family protein n=1 Tax=Haloimpatiens sp. FM7315 TaxID=3298609 RepID=UPI0035A2A56B